MTKKKKRFQLDYLSIGKYCALGFFFFFLETTSSRARLHSSVTYLFGLALVEFYVQLEGMFFFFFSSKGNVRLFFKIFKEEERWRIRL